MDTSIARRILEFVDEQGNVIQSSNNLERQQLAPRIIRESTMGKYVDIFKGGIECSPDTEGAVPEIEYLQSIPISALPAEVTTI